MWHIGILEDGEWVIQAYLDFEERDDAAQYVEDTYNDVSNIGYFYFDGFV